MVGVVGQGLLRHPVKDVEANGSYDQFAGRASVANFLPLQAERCGGPSATTLKNGSGACSPNSTSLPPPDNPISTTQSARGVF